jgi:hypothetical protein
MSSYNLETASGLHAFDMEGEWYVFLPALAKVVNKSNGNISVLLGRHASLHPSETDPQILLASKANMPAEWKRLVQTYSIARVSITPGGEHKRKKQGGPINLTLYPLEVCVKIVQHYSKDIDPAVTRAVEQFWLEVRPDQAVGEEEESKGTRPAHIRQQGSEDGQSDSVSDDLVPGGVKREPVSYLKFPTIMKGHRIIIDLTGIAEGDGDADSENVDALLSALSDNFLASVPPASVDSPLKRIYRLADTNISATLKDQCIRFGEWRSALWNWSRDDAPVSSTTFDGNISNLLLFAGYATAHAPIAYRIKPALAFDLSVVFGYKRFLSHWLLVTYDGFDETEGSCFQPQKVI